MSRHQLGVAHRCRALVSCPVLQVGGGKLKCSGSMEPAFYRGDILFLTNPANTPYEIGDITVYKMSADGIVVTDS